MLYFGRKKNFDMWRSVQKIRRCDVLFLVGVFRLVDRSKQPAIYHTLIQESASGAFRSTRTEIAVLVASTCQEKLCVTSVFYPLWKVLDQICTLVPLVHCVPAQRANVCPKRLSFCFILTPRLFHQDCTEILKTSWYGWVLSKVTQECTEYWHLSAG